jgi:acyl-ACP thioesterase
MIVKEYNGTIDYTSEVKKGSTFYFTFELKDANNNNIFHDDEINNIGLINSDIRKTSLVESTM